MPALPFPGETRQHRVITVAGSRRGALTVQRYLASRWLLLLWLAVVTTNAVAADSGESTPGVYPDARIKMLDNKLRLLDALLHRNEALRRIEESPDTRVSSLLAAARDAFVKARAMRARNELESCEEELRRGLEAISTASRMAGDPEHEAQLARNRYQNLSQLVSGFNEAFTRILAERPEEARLLDLSRVDKLMQRAQAHAQRQEFEAAIGLAQEARSLLEQALASSRHQQTLVYELRFATPADEYAYEDRHNRGHEALIRLLLAERAFPEEDRNSVLAALDENARQRAEAAALADRGRTPEGIRRLEQASAKLTQTLRRLGVPVE
ncbi:MAG TPA: hypothetical protein VLG93_05430 [Sulfuricaulis sp.]|nr:hypothetical protein [Sulfuricaulis sp.]